MFVYVFRSAVNITPRGQSTHDFIEIRSVKSINKLLKVLFLISFNAGSNGELRFDFERPFSRSFED